MRTTKAKSSVQPSLFPCQGSSVKDAQDGNRQIAKLSTYLKTHGGLFRLLVLFPGNMPVEKALRLAPHVLAYQRSGHFSRTDILIDGKFYRKGEFIPDTGEVHDVKVIRRKEVAL